MSQDRQDDEIAFLSIFVKGGGAAGAANLAAARAAAREAREAEKQATATMSLTKQHRAQKKRNAAEKAMKATRDVTQQGFESALHLQRPKGGNTVNRAAIGGRMVDNYQDAKRAAAASSSGLPVALVAGDRVQTAMGAGTVKKVISSSSRVIVSLPWGEVYLKPTDLVGHGSGPAVPITLEAAYRRAKALYASKQVREALAIWLSGARMLRERGGPQSRLMLTAFLGAASQAERHLGLTRRALEHAEAALMYGEQSSASKDKTKGLVARLKATVHSIKVELGEVSDSSFLAGDEVIASGNSNQKKKKKNTGGKRNGKSSSAAQQVQVSARVEDGICSNDLLEMDPEALSTVQNAIEEARAGDASTLKQLLEMAELLGNKDYNRGLSRAATEGSRVTALMVAAGYGQLGAMRQLIAMGASLLAVDAQGFTPLVWACRAGKVDAAKTLLEEFQSPWVKPSSKASPEIQELLNGVPEERRRTAPAPVQARARGKGRVKGKGQAEGKGRGRGKGQVKGKGNRSNRPSAPSKAKEPTAGARESKGRKLQAWAPSADEKAMQVGALDTSKGRDRNYDQFGANKKLGVKLQGYDEDEYTTRQVKAGKAQVAKADKAAKEIEKNNRVRNSKKNKGAKNNKNDEEDTYSAVQRKKGAAQAAAADSFTDAGVRGNTKKKISGMSAAAKKKPTAKPKTWASITGGN